jgi:hypothetical protein
MTNEATARKRPTKMNWLKELAQFWSFTSQETLCYTVKTMISQNNRVFGK